MKPVILNPPHPPAAVATKPDVAGASNAPVPPDDAAHAAAVQLILDRDVQGADRPTPPKVLRYSVTRSARGSLTSASQPPSEEAKDAGEKPLAIKAATPSTQQPPERVAATTFDHLFIEYSSSETQVAFLVHSPLSSSHRQDQLRDVRQSTLYTFDPEATVHDLLTCTPLLTDVYFAIPDHLTRASSVTFPLRATIGLVSKVSLCDSVQLSATHSLRSIFKPSADLVKDRLQRTFLSYGLADGLLGAIRFDSSRTISEDEKLKQIQHFRTHRVWKGQPYSTYPNDGLALMAASLLTTLQWAERYLGTKLSAFFHHPWTQRDEFAGWTAPHTGVFPMLGDGEDGKGEVRIGLAADWAAGTMEADMVQAAMMGGRTWPELDELKLPHDQPCSRPRPHYTVHCGDVYYMGLPQEVAMTFLGQKAKDAKYRQAVKWPAGSRGQLAVPGNHELYSGGYGYYRQLLPAMWVNQREQKQLASFFALSHADWLVIALDTGYDSYSHWPHLSFSNPQPSFDNDTIDLHPKQRAWLQTVLSDPAHSHKGLVFLSHHQVASAWDKTSGKTRFQQTVVDCIANAERRIIWLYGHEHRLSMYDGEQADVPLKSGRLQLRSYHRCVGNSGFPCEVSILPTEARRFSLRSYDDRLYSVEVDGLCSVPIAFNGFTSLTIRPGPSGTTGQSQLSIDYYTIRLQGNELTSDRPTWLYSETFGQRGGSVTRMDGQKNPNLGANGLTMVVHVPKSAALTLQEAGQVHEVQLVKPAPS